MNMIAGFEFASGGQVLLDKNPIIAPGPDRAVVFQQASLFPWLTVFENIVFGVKSRGISPDAVRAEGRTPACRSQADGFRESTIRTSCRAGCSSACRLRGH
jgi:ABC-type taurine transport system ATPase subunit